MTRNNSLGYVWKEEFTIEMMMAFSTCSASHTIVDRHLSLD
jgi:hypothetical protein